MSRVDHWIIPRKRNRNRIKSGKLGNARHNVKKGTNNARKMLGEPMLRRIHLVRVHMQYGKQIIRIMEVKNNEN